MTLNTLVQRHYGLHRRVTDEEVAAEIASIERVGTAFINDDHQFRLMVKLELALRRTFPTGLETSS